MEGYHTIILGSDGLWARVHRGGGGHRLGQPEHLLQLPGQHVPAFQTASGRTQIGRQNFMSADDFENRLVTLRNVNYERDHARVADCRVTGIYRYPKGIVVNTNATDINFLADQVVIATGIGPKRSPPGY